MIKHVFTSYTLHPVDAYTKLLESREYGNLATVQSQEGRGKACLVHGAWGLVFVWRCLLEAPHPQPHMHVHNCVALSDCQRNVEEAAFSFNLNLNLICDIEKCFYFIYKSI